MLDLGPLPVLTDGFDDETILDNICVFRAETNWESAEGCFIINFDEEARDDELILDNLDLDLCILLFLWPKKDADLAV